MNCERCGAPAAQGVVVCGYCRQYVSAELARTAIPCGQCRTLNAWGATRCLKCGTWLVVQCVFCGNLSPYTMSACLTCNEAFAGSRERKAARDADMQHQRTMQTVGTVGQVAAPFLGAVAGSMIGGYAGSHWGSSGWGYGGGHHQHNYDQGSYGGYDSGGGWAQGSSGYDAGSAGAAFDAPVDNSGSSDAGSSFFGGS